MTSRAPLIQTFIVLFAGLALTGCTTTRPVDSTVELAAQIEPGDHLVVYENTGRKLDIRLQSLAKDRLTGTLRSDDSKTVDVVYSDIEKIEVESIDRTKTGGVLLGAILGAALWYTVENVAFFPGY